MGMVIKLSLHLSPEANDLLESMSEETHSSKSDILRKSIALMKVAIETKREGKKLSIVDSKNHIEKEIIGI